MEHDSTATPNTSGANCWLPRCGPGSEYEVNPPPLGLVQLGRKKRVGGTGAHPSPAATGPTRARPSETLHTLLNTPLSDRTPLSSLARIPRLISKIERSSQWRGNQRAATQDAGETGHHPEGNCCRWSASPAACRTRQLRASPPFPHLEKKGDSPGWGVPAGQIQGLGCAMSLQNRRCLSRRALVGRVKGWQGGQPEPARNELFSHLADYSKVDMQGVWDRKPQLLRQL